ARDVRALTVELAPRDVDHPENLQRAADYVAAQLAAAATSLERQRYQAGSHTFENEIGRIGPVGRHPLVVGAHYDAFGMFGTNPGADDTASGVAALLELARLLHAAQARGTAQTRVPIELVAYSTEEPPYFGSASMGSAVHAGSLAAAGRAPLA